MATRGVRLRRTSAIVALAVAAATGASALGASKPQAKATPLTYEVTDAAGRVHRLMRKFTQAEREAAARRLQARARSQSTTQSRGAASNLMPMPASQLLTAPNGELIPDYSGATANYANSPILRKFRSALPLLCGTDGGGANNLGQCIPVAVAAPSPVAGEAADYYEIELGEYSEQLHIDLPGPYNPSTPGALGTRLRGYRQTNTTDSQASRFHYLGPLIVAQRNRPVRVRFTNRLPTGVGGNLFIPLDPSVVGSGPGPNVSDATRTTTRTDVLCKTGPADSVPAGCFTHNRATIHLHGGVTPWISDGTTHQWTTPAGEAEYPKGVSVYNVPDMENPGRPLQVGDPGAGVLTFYYTNQQSARLMFYHDHAAGVTRLNVYAGEAGPYLLQDPIEHDLVARGLIPAEQIPLVLQDKTFVDAERIALQDPTWNWGTGPVDPTTGRRQPNTGDLWWPHVYMPAQNPYDLSGANAMGRWHYGPWFWPPTTNIPFLPVPNPYYDPLNAPWQPPEVPGTPNPSVVAEAFFDTPLINGSAYPTLTVDPKAYRFRVLDASHDRFWNLSLFVAADKRTQTTEIPDPALPPTALCAGGVPLAECTEVRMVPASRSTPGYPPDWPADARVGGVPDPASKGPDWIQIGTEGGFLPLPTVVPSRPVDWNANPTTFNFGNVTNHALLLGPAERADVIVDFSAYAGKTLILYNDAPAAFPAADPRYDYYTGNPDLQDTGGAPSTLPGYGPNTRTVMQIHVRAGTPAPFDMAPLVAEFTSAPGKPGVFERDQDPIIVGQSAYDTVYTRAGGDPAFPSAYPYWGYARIQDSSMAFETVDGSRPTLPFEHKAMHDEMGAAFDDYGRMSAKLGVEIPVTNVTNQNFVMQGYADPPTELVRLSDAAVPIGDPGADGTQIWKITHNGVDTHPIHFHLFHVQLLNRVGWDGAIRLPEASELGWKDTVRVSPLEDTIVALRPIAPAPATLPFEVPNSFRPLEPSLPIGSGLGFTNLDPLGNAVTVTNDVVNFGWEYVWHCHILSHEENDMMRAVVFAATPKAPGIVSAGNGAPGVIDLSWTNNSVTATGFRLERSTDRGFAGNLVRIDLPVATTTYADTGWASTPSPAYYYRIVALNTVGSTVPGYPTLTAESAPSVFRAVTPTPAPLVLATPGALAFASQNIGTTSTAQSVKVSNVGSASLDVSGIGLGGPAAADFGQSGDCSASLAPGSSCTILVTFAPTVAGARAASLQVATNDPMTPVETVALSGTGLVPQPQPVATPATLAFTRTPVSVAAVPLAIVLANVGEGDFEIGGISIEGANAAEFSQVNLCGRGVRSGAECTITVTFAPQAVGNRTAALVIRAAEADESGVTVPLAGLGATGRSFRKEVAAAPSPGPSEP